MNHLQQQSHGQDSHQKKVQLRAQQEHISDMQSQLVALSEENEELKKRMRELANIRKNQKNKIDEMAKNQEILLRDGTPDYRKVYVLKALHFVCHVSF